MEQLYPDTIQHLMTFMNPREWYIFCLLSKTCRNIVRKFMTARRAAYFNILNTYKGPKAVICLRPFMKLHNLSFGCNGDVSMGLCIKHRQQKEICIKCKTNIVSDLTFGLYCNSPKCRDYIWVLLNGNAVKKYRFFCINASCNRETDILGGKCLICSRDEQIAAMTSDVTDNKQCIIMTKSGDRCKKKTKSWTQKCSLHASKLPK